MSIEIFPHHVLINGQKIERPNRIAPSQWMFYWERVTQTFIGKRDKEVYLV